MKRLVSLIIIPVFFFSFFSCKKDDLSFFQNNDPDPEYELFSILDDYPPLKDFFTEVDQNEFNHKLADLVDNNLDLMPFFCARWQ